MAKKYTKKNLSKNYVCVRGNLAAEPEMRYAPSGDPFTFFVVATNTTVVNENGEEKDYVEYHDVICWNGTAEAVAQYLRKGRFVEVEGSMHYEAVPITDTGKKDGKQLTYNGRKLWDHNVFIRAYPGGITFFPDFVKHTETIEVTEEEENTVEISAH